MNSAVEVQVTNPFFHSLLFGHVSSAIEILDKLASEVDIAVTDLTMFFGRTVRILWNLKLERSLRAPVVAHKYSTH